MKMCLKGWVLIGVLSILAGCSSTTSVQRDSAPSRQPTAAEMRDAVPRAEPLAKYGNMASYEVFGKRYYTRTSSEGYVERGVASWYGNKFHGRRTSSGEVYDMYKMTAAHKTLPLPSYVEVINLDNGRKVIVRVNDRGPFHGNRIIDLSYSAATKLGIVAQGTGRVEVRAINPQQQARPSQSQTVTPVAANTSGVQQTPVFIQVGAFSTPSRADEVKSQLESQLTDAVQISPLMRPQGNLYRVRVGPLRNFEAGQQVANRLFNLGFPDSRIVIE